MNRYRRNGNSVGMFKVYKRGKMKKYDKIQINMKHPKLFEFQQRCVRFMRGISVDIDLEM